MKKLIITCLLSVTSLLTIEYLYIQTASKSHLDRLISILKNDSSNHLKSTPKEESEENLLAQDIEVLEVKTGFYAGSLWYPSIIVKFKNNANSDIKQHIDAKAIFINTTTNEQIGVHTKYLSTSSKFFLQGTSLRKQFKSDLGYRGGLSIDLKISVKLYLEDELIGTYSVKNKEI